EVQRETLIGACQEVMVSTTAGTILVEDFERPGELLLLLDVRLDRCRQRRALALGDRLANHEAGLLSDQLGQALFSRLRRADHRGERISMALPVRRMQAEDLPRQIVDGR